MDKLRAQRHNKCSGCRARALKDVYAEKLVTVVINNDATLSFKQGLPTDIATERIVTAEMCTVWQAEITRLQLLLNKSDNYAI